jgi:predicted dehydrogenase
LRIAVVGAGYASEHVRGFGALDDVEVVAVCARRRESAERFAREHDIALATDSLEDVLAIPGLDAITVASPPATHLEVVAAAFDRGLHVLCEKPLGCNPAESERMLELARTAGVVHAVNYDYRVVPDLTRMHDLVRNGYVGAVRHGAIHWMGDYHADEASSWTWRNDLAVAGAGVLGDLNHAIDYLRWTFGDAARVAADVRVCVPERPDHESGAPREVDAEDVASILAVTTEGIPVVVQLSRCATGGGQLVIESYGADGMLRMEMPDTSARWTTSLSGRLAGDAQPRVLSEPSPWDELMTTERAFVEAIRSDGETAPLCTFEDGLAVSRIVGAIYASHGSGAWVELGNAR